MFPFKMRQLTAKLLPFHDMPKECEGGAVACLVWQNKVFSTVN